MHALLRGAAPRAADWVLLGEIAMGLALIAGAVLARCRRYRAHAWCQSAVVLLNLALVAFFMARSFSRGVAPGLWAHLGHSYYWLAAAHGALGTCAELLTLYILLAAGTPLLPRRFRLVRYKLWMRSALALWWLVLLLGLATYLRWYGYTMRHSAIPPVPVIKTRTATPLPSLMTPSRVSIPVRRISRIG